MARQYTLRFHSAIPDGDGYALLCSGPYGPLWFVYCPPELAAKRPSEPGLYVFRFSEQEPPEPYDAYDALYESHERIG